MQSFFLVLRSLFAWFVMARRGFGVAMLAMFVAVSTPSCAAVPAYVYREGNTCDLTRSQSGHPDCLPPSGFFCEDPPAESEHVAEFVPDPRHIAQLFPSKQALGGNQPICPPNATRLVQDQDWKDARDGAKAIGKTVGRVLTVCDHIIEELAKQPDHMLAGQNTRQPEELEARFLICTRELDSLPAIPAYEDPWLAGAAALGFEEGYGEGANEVWRRLILIELGVAAVEVAVTAGIGLAKVVVTRGIRASLSVVRRMPIFIPGAMNGGGAFLKSLPRAAAKAVAKGSSRRLGNNLIKAGKTRLPGEFSHHIAAHGDPRAEKSVEILEGFGIHVDNEVNGIFLPGYESSPNPLKKVVHGNMHTDAYHNAVYRRLKAAKTRADAEEVLRKIALGLEKGIAPK